MIKGTLKFFSAAKGFGFITPDDDGKDVFLPAATIAAAGAGKLSAGQRVAFEQEADVKGPKAVNLRLLDEQPRPAPAAQSRLLLYCDPGSDEASDVLAALEAAGRQARVVDYTATPPERDELKRLSLVLQGADQSLVRRYDALFLDLQLDDRFIAENEFWTAIVEHPSLINGPILVEGGKARIVKKAGDVRAFLGLNGPAEMKRSPKEISPRMAAMMKALAMPAPLRAPAPEPAPAAAAPAKPRIVVPIRDRAPLPEAKNPAPATPPQAPAPQAKKPAMSVKLVKKTLAKAPARKTAKPAPVKTGAKKANPPLKKRK